jgi:hypothetical protein
MLYNLLTKQDTAVLHLQDTLVLQHDVDHGAVPVDGGTVLVREREPAFHQLPLVQLVHSEDALHTEVLRFWSPLHRQGTQVEGLARGADCTSAQLSTPQMTQLIKKTPPCSTS